MSPLGAMEPMPLDGLPPLPAEVLVLQPAGDLNGDGTADFVAQVEFPEEYRIERRPVLSGPAGRWTMSPSTVDAFRRGHQFWADLDGDGRVDVAFGRIYNGTRVIGVGLWPSWSHRETDGSWRQYTFDGSLEPADDLVSCADIDGDGHPDFVVAGPRGAAILWNAGKQGRTEPLGWSRRTIDGSLSDADALATDLDGDGRPDLVLWSREGAAAQVWRNEGARGWKRFDGMDALEAAGPGAAVPMHVDGRPALGVLADRGTDGFRSFETWTARGASGAGWQRAARHEVVAAQRIFVAGIGPGGAPAVCIEGGGSIAVFDDGGTPVGRFDHVPEGTEPLRLDAARTVLLVLPAEPGGPIRWMRAPSVPSEQR